MNANIARLAGAALVLLASLVVATTYWQTWARPALAERQDNAIQRVVEFTVKRGDIAARSRLLARNRAIEKDGRTLYFRRYPVGPLTAHVVGYSTVSRSRAGLERSLNDYLTGSRGSLASLVETSLEKLKGKPVEGNDVGLSIDLVAQQVAREQLGSRCGAVAALDPRTGRVLVLYTSPSYDPTTGAMSCSAASRVRSDARSSSTKIPRCPPASTPCTMSAFGDRAAASTASSGEVTVIQISEPAAERRRTASSRGSPNVNDTTATGSAQSRSTLASKSSSSNRGTPGATSMRAASEAISRA